MPEGTVVEFDSEKGYGNIQTEEGDLLAVHRSAIADEGLMALHPGDVVEFRVGRNKFGRRAALEVRRIGWEDEENEDGSPREWTF